MGLALLLAIAAVVMSVIKWSAPAPVATTTTMTAAPAGPAYTAQQVAAAKKEACDASALSDVPITTAQLNFVATVGERGSDRYRQMLSNLQTVVMVETEYVRSHVAPATPKDVADAINDDINALITLVEANTREVADAEANQLIESVKRAGERVAKVCD
uniref:Haemophore haem-binding domain-containing protein n=1 Tax=Mycobacterium riyadhense TaxID=486698 RepID=A0A653EY42_9MYCO|nr:hypothetical protein BIN_B_04462 [Mycobacterium riyadhense]